MFTIETKVKRQKFIALTGQKNGVVDTVSAP